jgi:hypothetical protein
MKENILRNREHLRHARSLTAVSFMATICVVTAAAQNGSAYFIQATW